MTPNQDSFTIGAYWTSRAEPLLQVVQKTTQTLKGLREIDHSWFRSYRSVIDRSLESPNRICLTEEDIKKLCLAGIKEGDLLKSGKAKEGFIFGVSTGQNDSKGSRISFVVGTAFHALQLNNSCVVDIPVDQRASSRLLYPQTSKKLLRLLVRLWKPDYAVLTSKFLKYTLDVRNEVGWLTFKRRMANVPKLRGGISYRKDELGHWFMVDKIGDFSNGTIGQLALLKESKPPVMMEFG